MYVTLLFDVEDLVDPRSDDTTLALARIFAEEGAPGTMMVVGEKARLWERRGRRDLIEAMAAHDVGLHTNMHSVHPTVAEYLEDKGWDDGIEEAIRREQPGVESHKRIFGQAPSCWGRGGSTWGPQVAAALPKLGIPAMVYPFTHLADPSLTVHYFCNTPCYYWHFGGFDATFADDAAFAPVLEQVQQHVDDSRRQGVAWSSVFVCHPAMVRAKRFWDDLNYNHGVNTPPERWVMPEYRSEAEWETAKGNLRRFARALANMPGIQLRTVRQMNALLLPAPQAVSPAELQAAARSAMARGDINGDEWPLSPAERLYLWAKWLASGRGSGPIPWRYVEGPVEEPSSGSVAGPVAVEAVLQAARELSNAVEAGGRLPGRLRLGQAEVGTGTLYRALAAACAQDPGQAVTVAPGPQVPAIGDVLREEVARFVPGWMHKPDLDASRLAAYTRLQSWTLKPARLA